MACRGLRSGDFSSRRLAQRGNEGHALPADGEASLALDLALAPAHVGFDVGEGHDRAVGHRDVERSAPNVIRSKASATSCRTSGDRDSEVLGAVRTVCTVLEEARMPAAFNVNTGASRTQVGHRPPRGGRAVVGDDAAHQRQVRSVAELHGHRQHEPVARRRKDRRAGEALLRAALGEIHRRQDREHQAGNEGQPQLADARDDGVASHGSTRTTTCLPAPIRAPCPRGDGNRRDASTAAANTIRCRRAQASCYARAPGRTSRCDSRLAGS